MWRARRFRRLLNLIDHLPRHTYYSQAVLNDPEHMAMLERVKEQGDPGPAPLPPLATWSPEVDMGATINDSLQQLLDAIVRSNVDKTKQNAVPPIRWTPRPGRPQDGDARKPRISRAEQEARHEYAKALFLPPKVDSDD